VLKEKNEEETVEKKGVTRMAACAGGNGAVWGKRFEGAGALG
jgi:hypothetical protein